jgi:hypothetical protein
MTKPVLLAKAYAWYLEDKIDAFALEAVAHVIHSAFLRDLLEFLRDDFILVDGECKGRLVAAGLLYEANESWNGNRVEYRQTTLGATFLHAIKRPDVSHLD